MSTLIYRLPALAFPSVDVRAGSAVLMPQTGINAESSDGENVHVLKTEQLNNMLGTTPRPRHPFLKGEIGFKQLEDVNVSQLKNGITASMIVGGMAAVAAAGVFFFCNNHNVIANPENYILPSHLGKLFLGGVTTVFGGFLMGILGQRLFSIFNMPYSDQLTQGNRTLPWGRFVEKVLCAGDEFTDRKNRKAALQRYGITLRQLKYKKRPVSVHGAPLTGDDVLNIFHEVTQDPVFTRTARLMWSLRAVGRGLDLSPKRMKAPGWYYSTLATVMHGKRQHAGVGGRYAKPLARALERTAQYVEIVDEKDRRNNNPVPASALAAFLSAYYVETGQGLKARHMNEATRFALKGKVGLAFREHMEALGDMPLEPRHPNERALRGLHLLGAALLIESKGSGREFSYIGKEYAMEAAAIFNDIAGRHEAVQKHPFRTLAVRADQSYQFFHNEIDIKDFY